MLAQMEYNSIKFYNPLLYCLHKMMHFHFLTPCLCEFNQITAHEMRHIKTLNATLHFTFHISKTISTSTRQRKNGMENK